MADTQVLKATRRTVTGKQVKALRRQGRLPAVLYGHNVEPVAISLDAREASLLLPRMSSSTVVTVDVDGESFSALVREKQKDYLKNSLLHVDFQVVSMTEKIKAEVRIDTEGTAPAVKDFNAVIVTNLNQVLVEALPGDLPERIVVDLSILTEVGSAINVRDLEVPAGVEILTSADEAVIIATGAAPEEVEEEVVEEGAEPEVIERGKREEEEEE